MPFKLRKLSEIIRAEFLLVFRCDTEPVKNIFIVGNGTEVFKRRGAYCVSLWALLRLLLCVNFILVNFLRPFISELFVLKALKMYLSNNLENRSFLLFNAKNHLKNT